MSIYTDYFNNNINEEHCVMFDEVYTVPPTTTGSYSGSQNWTATVISTPISSNADSFMPGQRSWRFRIDTQSNYGNRLRNNNGSFMSLVSDNSYSAGVWFRSGTLPIATGGAAVFWAMRPASRGFFVSIYKNEVTGDPQYGKNQISVTVGDQVVTFENDNYPSIAANVWNYIAIRRDGANGYIYLNGQQIWSSSNIAINTTASMVGYDFGNTSTTWNQDIDFAGAYIAGYNDVTATEISNLFNIANSMIYNSSAMLVSNSVFVDPATSVIANIEITKTPATASATFLHPNITITSPDSTNTTTSFVATVEFLPDYTIFLGTNINNVINTTMDASTELINNVTISAGTSESFSATEFTASGLFVDPTVSRPAMIASALMVNATISVTPSYFKLIKEANPLFYSNFDSSTLINYGSWGTNINATVGSTVSKNILSTLNMGLVGEGKSWQFTGSYYNAPNYIQIDGPDDTTMANLLTGTFNAEYWFKKLSTNNSGVGLDFGNIELSYTPTSSISYAKEDSFAVVVRNVVPYVDTIGATRTDRKYYFAANAMVDNVWNHVVLKSTGTSFAIYVNGSYIGGGSFSPNNWYNNYIANPPGVRIRSSQWDNTQQAEADTQNGQALFDEFAIYDYNLSNSQIIDHYSFINNLDPSPTVYPVSFEAFIEFGNHQFVVTSNVDAIAIPIISSALFVSPSILAVKNINISATALTASAINTDVTVYWGWTIYATPAIAYAERPESYFLNDLYYQYVQTNINPYRYVTFDSANAALDYGTDADYSVTPTIIGGNIVNPDLGINGKSVKTTGISYVTDGIILNESEWNDDWGTGNNDYVSSFWMQRALDDTSTTGLRILWNLNGYKDNQHVVVYHYQNKLHFQINNQSGTYHTVTSANNVNIFDYLRHHIVIYSHFNNNHNYISIYVDGVSIIGAHDIGNYKITTLNASSADSGPNNESNNHPRLSVGCLITPFGFTALPVQPTNTKLIIDEIFWDKDGITQNQVTNLYAAMPDKSNKVIVAEVITASIESFMPEISTQVILSVNAATASSIFINPSLYIERFITNTADVMNSSALMTSAIAFQNAIIVSDIMIGTATFNNAGIIITIPGGPMIGSAKIIDDNVKINGWSIVTMRPYVRYLRISNLIGRRTTSMREIK